MKRFSITSSVIFASVALTLNVFSEPPYDLRYFSGKLPFANNGSTTSETIAYVDSSFSITAEWFGSPQWMTGVNNNLGAFNGSIARGANLYGSNLNASQYGILEIRLDADTADWSNAMIFRRDNVLSAPYDAYQVGKFPGSVWDVTDSNNPRRLNVGFVEWDDGPDPLPPVNGFWDPDTSANGKYEYLFVMHSDYDSTGLYYEGTNILYDTLDLMCVWTPRVATGHTFFESDSGRIVITPHIGLTAEPSNTSIKLEWVRPGPEPDHYRIYYSDSSNPNQLLVYLASNAIAYTHVNLLPDQRYYYQMFSYDSDDSLIYSSNIAEARTREITLQMDLLAQWNLRSNYGDVWGYTDSLTGTEYALLCARSQGVSIIDITDSPLVEVGLIAGSFSTSDVKDVKTYSHYAVVICEAAATQIFDISDPTNPDSIASISGGRHNGMVDGNYVYLVGGAFGGLQIYSIADPQNPTWVGEYDPFYYHDVAIHNDTLAACGIYGDGIDILDVTDKSSPQLVGHFNYANSGAHNAAFGEDGDYLFIGDEIGGGRYTRVFDISNFNDIQQVADIIVNSQAVTHNCYVLGNHLYIAHYAEGLRVWNIRRPYLPYEVAAYDTHPNEFAGFIGAWGVYPYFASGKIVISDMQLGLFAFNSTVKETVCCLGVRGNTNYDMDELNILDLLFLVNYIFRNGEEPACPEEGDVNGDGTLGNIIDLLYIVNVLYRSGPPPPACP